MLDRTEPDAEALAGLRCLRPLLRRLGGKGRSKGVVDVFLIHCSGSQPSAVAVCCLCVLLLCRFERGRVSIPAGKGGVAMDPNVNKERGWIRTGKSSLNVRNSQF